MKREIKFRAWDGEKMVIVNDVVLSGETPWGYWRENSVTEKSNVLMQFTGLKDKNGKEIYEGDIVKGFKKEQKDKDGENGYEVVDKVEWRYGFRVFGKNLSDAYTKDNNLLWQFMWHETGSFTNRSGWYYQIDDMEVVGNIYQNSDLLK